MRRLRAVILGLAAFPCAAFAQTPDPRDVARCRAIADVQAQFTCFDALKAKLKRQIAKPSPKPINPLPVAPQPPTAAQDAYAPLPFTPRQFGQAFDNTAISLGLDERSKFLNCSSEAWTVCTYKVPEFASIMAEGKSADIAARSVFTVLAGGADDGPQLGLEGLSDWLILIKLVQPELPPSARGTLVKRLLADSQDGGMHDVPIADFVYSVAAPVNMGLWLSIKKLP